MVQEHPQRSPGENHLERKNRYRKASPNNWEKRSCRGYPVVRKEIRSARREEVLSKPERRGRLTARLAKQIILQAPNRSPSIGPKTNTSNMNTNGKIPNTKKRITFPGAPS